MTLVDNSVRPAGLVSAEPARVGALLAWAESLDPASSPLSSAAGRIRAWRWLRYLLTSGLSTVISEVALVALYAAGVTGATMAAVLATLVGTIPSYLISRYWIWPEADRRGVGRQMALYWLTTAASLVVSSLATGAAVAHAPAGRELHVLVAGVAYGGTYLVLWVAKYLVYQRVVFVGPRAHPA
ncbi:MAG: GtrA family protein [Candidatus Dormibacteria bacterium]